MLSDCQNLNRLSWSPRKIMVKDLWQRSGLAWFCACAESCLVFNTGPYTDLPDNSILITANMQSGFPSSHQLKSYVASKSRLKLAACAVLSADVLAFVLLCRPKWERIVHQPMALYSPWTIGFWHDGTTPDGANYTWVQETMCDLRPVRILLNLGRHARQGQIYLDLRKG